MKKILLASTFLVVTIPAWAQNPQCPTRPPGDSTNACASTAFVQNAVGIWVLVGNDIHNTNSGSVNILQPQSAVTINQFPGVALNVLHGSLATPITAADVPTVVVSRVDNQSSATGDNSLGAAVVVNMQSSGTVQANGIVTKVIKTGASGDAVGLYSAVNQSGPNAAAYGVFQSVTALVPLAAAIGMQTSIGNFTNTDEAWSPTMIAPHYMALDLNYGASPVRYGGAAINIRSTAGQWDVGIAINQNNNIRTATMWDGGQAGTSYKDTGTHATAWADLSGTYGYGLRLAGTYSNSPIRIPSNAYITSRNNAGAADLNMIKTDASDNLVLLNGAATLTSASVLTATTFSGNATTSTTATNANNSAIVDDAATSATMNLVWVTSNTGNLPLKVTSSKFNVNPNSGLLSIPKFNTTATGSNLTGNNTFGGTITFSAQANIGTGPGFSHSTGNAFLLAGGTAGYAFNNNAGTVQLFGITNTGQLLFGSTAPTLSSCGTSPSVVGSLVSGTVTMGTGAPTGCVITFSTAFSAAPHCTVTWRATPLATQTYTVSTTAITTTQTATSSNLLDYTCSG